ncbi:MAG: cob(I)yrinic acid a,c-diamide adenosyltransferase [Betaproteobacteria bacterium]|nr:cob(I)yrinic acid a,c-diamide adenosyltransferase [Betaproteobacteria bacterium]
MGHRLSKIYTRTGDAGETGLGDGSRVPKNHLRIVTLGDIDELNSSIGSVLAEDLPPGVREALEGIQHDLFDLGGEVSIPGRIALTDDHVLRLEGLLDQFNGALPPLKEFILPGGSRASSAAHLARTICRRAERSLIALAGIDQISTSGRLYLNRLSDLLFVLGRVLNRHAGRGDVLWQPGKTVRKS